MCLYFISLFLLQVTMLDKSAAERACKDPNPIIDGRKANVNLAYLGAKPRSPLTGKYQTQALNLLEIGYLYFKYCSYLLFCHFQRRSV